MKQTDGFVIVSLGYYANIAIPADKVGAMAAILADSFGVKQHYADDGAYYARLKTRWDSDPVMHLTVPVRDYSEAA